MGLYFLFIFTLGRVLSSYFYNVGTGLGLGLDMKDTMVLPGEISLLPPLVFPSSSGCPSVCLRSLLCRVSPIKLGIGGHIFFRLSR